MKHSLTPVRMANCKRLTTSSVSKDAEDGGCNVQEYNLSGKPTGSFLKNQIHLPHDLAILCIYSTFYKAYVHTKTCTQMFTAALSAVAPNWKQPKHPSACEWVNKLWCIFTMEYDSAIKGINC